MTGEEQAGATPTKGKENVVAVVVLLVILAVAVGFGLWNAGVFTPAPEPKVPAVTAPPAPPRVVVVPEKPKEWKWGITQAPDGLPATGIKKAWEDILEISLKEMKSAAENWQKDPDRTEIMVSYGLLQSFGQLELRELKEPFVAVFKSDLGPTFYQWALPAVKAMFSAMPQGDRDDYLRIIAYASGLLGRYSDHYQYELKYWEWLEKDGCYVWGMAQRESSADFPPCTVMFARVGPDGKTNPYRKVDAFIFRRVHFDGIGADWMKYWVDRAWYDLTH